MIEQEQQLRRIKGKIGQAIVGFFKLHGFGTGFRLDHLVSHVRLRATCTSASVDRVMRALRAKGSIDYVCVKRGESLYQITSHRPQ